MVLLKKYSVNQKVTHSSVINMIRKIILNN